MNDPRVSLREKLALLSFSQPGRLDLLILEVSLMILGFIRLQGFILEQPFSRGIKYSKADPTVVWKSQQLW